MNLGTFDRASLAERLTLLSAEERVAFAALAAERLAHFYHWFHRATRWGDPAPLARAIDLVWAALAGGAVSDETMRVAIRECEAVTPDTEEFSTPLASRALDAAAAAALALECMLEPRPDTAAEAGEVAWEAAFGAEQMARLDDPDTVHVAVIAELEAASRGDLVRREEALQEQSLQRLPGIDFDAASISRLRSDFGRG